MEAAISLIERLLQELGGQTLPSASTMLQPGVQASPDESGLCTFIIVCKEVKSLYLHFVPHLFTKSVTHQFLCFFFFLRLWMTLGCQAWTELTAWQSIWWS